MKKTKFNHYYYTNLRLALVLTVAVPGMAAMQSCTDWDDSDCTDSRIPNALVTVCPAEDGTFAMVLDDNTVLHPTNLKTSPFGDKEVRALVNYTDETDGNAPVRNVKVNWVDSIRTKLPVETGGPEADVALGDDPLEIINDWVTVAEDGYITLRIRTRMGHVGAKHIINLVSGTNPDNPFELVLRHNANGDTDGNYGDALIAFNLNNMPARDADKVKIKLVWTSFSGRKSAEFDLKMRPE